jgi:putative PIN family toxin of toxin-antitoxin system
VRIVLETNVFVSGVFFSGPPFDVLEAWRRGSVKFVVSPEILDEYRRTGEELARQFPEADLTPWLELVTVKPIMVDAPRLAVQVCSDPDDDKFLACAVASGTKIVVTGDKALLKASGFQGTAVLRPRDFVNLYLKTSGK